MGTNTLTSIGTASPVEATGDQLDQYKQALGGNIVPRNTNGVPTNEGGSCGMATYQFNGVHSSSYFVNGSLVDFTQLVTQSNGIVSGVEAASSGGFPGFLTAGGAASLTATLDATTTPLVLNISGSSATISSDISFTVTAGHSANNTALVNDTEIVSDPFWSTSIGEFFDTTLTIDTAGSEITGAVGEKHFFTITNGSATELFFAEIVSSTVLRPIYRGMGGTSRIAFSDNDTITKCVTTYLFTDSSGTAYESNLVPLCVDTLPSAGTAGQYAFRTSDQTWHYDDGASYTEVARIWVGFACASNNTDNDYVGYFPFYNDFVKAWDDTLKKDLVFASASTIRIPVGFTCSVAGITNVANSEKTISLATAGDRESGVSESASTYYFIYVDDNFKFYFSTVMPRIEDGRKGFYHPRKYWRCVGVTFNDESSDMSAVVAPGLFFGKESDIRQGNFNHTNTSITPNTNQLFSSKFKCEFTTVIKYLAPIVVTGANKIVVGIYSDSSNAPSKLLQQTNTYQIVATNDYYVPSSLRLRFPVIVTRSKYYWTTISQDGSTTYATGYGVLATTYSGTVACVGLQAELPATHAALTATAPQLIVACF